MIGAENTRMTQNNRLQTTRVTSPSFAPVDYSYTIDSDHGYMTNMPHLSQISWNFLERISSLSSKS